MLHESFKECVQLKVCVPVATAVQFCAMCSEITFPEQGSWTRWSHIGLLQPDPFCDYVILPSCSVSWTNAIRILF